MMIKSRLIRTGLTVSTLAVGLSLAACGTPASQTPAPAQPPVASSAPASPSASSSATMTPVDAPFGAACSAVPTSGKGSFDGMSADPVATAASNNPLLSTLVTAVKKAGLVDTLNNADGITVFAPTNDAFAKIDPATLKKVLADKKTLTAILTEHVVAGQLDPSSLAGKHPTLNKAQGVTVTGSGENFTVNGNSKVLCGNVKTANATVYIVDTVLLPKS